MERHAAQKLAEAVIIFFLLKSQFLQNRSGKIQRTINQIGVA